jgi:hypothetical protein
VAALTGAAVVAIAAVIARRTLPRTLARPAPAEALVLAADDGLLDEAVPVPAR